ncbi:LCP family protein [Paenibacillus sp. NPDC058071]|uniref:LCP family protein n=1 Tax=Paenibacillus sp. NPDC058071 TaxID=3346326 RepID=UPI0036DC59E2
MTQGSDKLPPRGAARRKGSASPSPGKPKKKKKNPVLRAVLGGLLAGVILVGAYFGYLAWKADEAIGNIGEETVDNIKIKPSESVKNKAVSMVLLGLDSRPKGGGMNTDVMMVAAFNPNTKSATVVSIPRDSLLVLDGYADRKANAHYNAFYNQKLKELIKEGKSAKDAKVPAEADAKRAMSDMMGKYFGIETKYTAVINFKGFTDVVDALGGVEVDVDIRMKYKDTFDGTDIDLQKGRQLLDGDKALDFIRYRKSNDGKNMSSDFDRNKRETEVIAAVVDKMKSVGGITKLGGVIEAVGDNLKINMPSSEIKNMMAAYFGINSSDVQFISLEGNWKSPYVYLNEPKLAEARAALQAKMAE